MAILDLAAGKAVKTQLETLPNPVTLHVFTQELECAYCRETRQLAEALAAVVPDRVRVEVHNFQIDRQAVEQYRIDRIPAIAVVGAEDYGIRFYGIPGGYEFTSLVQAVKIVGLGDSGLSPVSRSKLGALTKPVHIKVYVTQTCPYCPGAVQLAHQLAVASPLVTAEMIEASEFPQLVMRDQVMSVPKTVITGSGMFEGALPEALYVDQVISWVAGGGV